MHKLVSRLQFCTTLCFSRISWEIMCMSCRRLNKSEKFVLLAFVKPSKSFPVNMVSSFQRKYLSLAFKSNRCKTIISIINLMSIPVSFLSLAFFKPTYVGGIPHSLISRSGYSKNPIFARMTNENREENVRGMNTSLSGSMSWINVFKSRDVYGQCFYLGNESS